jgi:hypothetical protein
MTSDIAESLLRAIAPYDTKYLSLEGRKLSTDMMVVEICKHNCVLPKSRVWFRQFLFRNIGHRWKFNVNLVISQNEIQI